MSVTVQVYRRNGQSGKRRAGSGIISIRHIVESYSPDIILNGFCNAGITIDRRSHHILLGGIEPGSPRLGSAACIGTCIYMNGVRITVAQEIAPGLVLTRNPELAGIIGSQSMCPDLVYQRIRGVYIGYNGIPSNYEINSTLALLLFIDIT